MKTVLNEKNLIVECCRDNRQDQVINEILTSRELKSYISSILKGNRNVASQDILHDTIISFIKACQKPNFKLNESPIAYLKAIARNCCYMHFRKKNIHFDNVDDLDLGSKDWSVREIDRKVIVQELLEKVGKDCKQVLYLWAMKYRMHDIAEKMDYGSSSYTKKKKHLCLKKLVAYIESKPKLKEELKNYV